MLEACGSYDTWPNPLQGGDEVFHCHTRGVYIGLGENTLAIREQHQLLKLISFCLFPVWLKHYCIQCFTVLCSSWQLRHQDAIGRSVWISIPGGWLCDDLSYCSCNWSGNWWYHFFCLWQKSPWIFKYLCLLKVNEELNSVYLFLKMMHAVEIKLMCPLKIKDKKRKRGIFSFNKILCWFCLLSQILLLSLCLRMDLIDHKNETWKCFLIL